jgi:cellulose synthase/poly-beta-1,6-N-acetylglucosamine synthase-like glycosyltransferase
VSAVENLVVAIPARDEESLLPACLRSVTAAVAVLREARPGIHLVVAVALDGCTDGSARVVGEWDVATVVLPGRGVGAARDAAIQRGLSVLRMPREGATWVACTDADTVVPSRWLVRHVMWAERGADLVVGTAEPVGVARGEALAAWHARHQLVEGHTHVHGANLGVRADRWRQVGGFGQRTVGEDVDLVERVRTLTGRWVATDTTRVLTSGRPRSRVDGGFADYLRDLDAETG